MGSWYALTGFPNRKEESSFFLYPRLVEFCWICVQFWFSEFRQSMEILWETTKTSPCCRSLFQNAKAFWWQCETTVVVTLGIVIWQFSLLAWVGKCVWVEQVVKLQPWKGTASWHCGWQLWSSSPLKLEADMQVIDKFKTTRKICTERVLNPSSWGLD